MSKKIPYDESLFSDSTDVATEILEDYLKNSEYDDDQTEALIERFKTKLEDFFQEYMEDLPVPRANDESDDE